MTITMDVGRFVDIDEARGRFRVARSAFTSPELFELEKRAIFDKCWLYVGHESEISSPGQYHVRRVGNREVIFNRDRNGNVNAFLNSCPHRGARLCTQRNGSLPVFYCYYHGWSFNSDGKLRKLPDEEAFPKGINADGSLNMKSVPRIDNYRGLYFVSFDQNIVSLPEYLGNAKEYIDLCLAQGEAGMEIIEGAHDYASSANWKALVENSVDGNHLVSLHSSYLDYLKTVDPTLGGGTATVESDPLAGHQLDLGNGHTVVEFPVPWGRVAGKWWPAWGEETKPLIAENYRRLAARVGEKQAHRLANISRNMIIFPNLAIIDGTGLTLRVIHPEAPGTMHVSSYAMAEKGENEEVRRLRLQAFLEFLGPGGLATPDDIEAFYQCQLAYNNLDGLPMWNDISKGDLTAKQWRFDQEGSIRTFWRQWARQLAQYTHV